MATILKSDTYLKTRQAQYINQRRIYTDKASTRKTISPAWLLISIPLFFYLPFSISSLITAGILLAIISSAKDPLTARDHQELLKLSKQHRPWQQGLNGELAVEQELTKLPADYYILHDITINNHQIDHVVISPRGVIAIETKNYYGNYTSNGSSWHRGKTIIKSPQHQAYNNAKALSHSIGLKVQPVVVLINASFRGTGLCPVINLNSLLNFITSPTPSISDPQKIANKILLLNRR